jgi:hypothetical protein
LHLRNQRFLHPEGDTPAMRTTSLDIHSRSHQPREKNGCAPRIRERRIRRSNIVPFYEDPRAISPKRRRQPGPDTGSGRTHSREFAEVRSLGPR